MFYFDEELQEWVDDESGEIEAPLPPKEELKYRNEPPSPPSLGLGGRYAMGKLPNDYVPEERPSGLSMPSMLNPKDYGDPMAGSGPYDPETSAMITGYGKNLMLRKAGNPAEQPWLTPGGAIAPPEYVQDIENTMGELDRGEMSETQLGEKIKQNAGIPPKPDESKMTEFELRQHIRQKPEYKQMVEEAKAAYEKQFAYTDINLLSPAQKIQHQKDVARVEQDAGKTIEDSVINEHRKSKAEEARKAAATLAEQRRDENRKEQSDLRAAEAAAKAAEKAQKEAEEVARKAATKAEEDRKKSLQRIEKQLEKYGVSDPDEVPPTLAKNPTVMGLVKKYKSIEGGFAEAGESSDLPEPAMQAVMKRGEKPTTFKNGQVWQLVNGKPKRIK